MVFYEFEQRLLYLGRAKKKTGGLILVTAFRARVLHVLGDAIDLGGGLFEAGLCALAEIFHRANADDGDEGHDDDVFGHALAALVQFAHGDS
jgi:hypothetical protein